MPEEKRKYSGMLLGCAAFAAIGFLTGLFVMVGYSEHVSTPKSAYIQQIQGSERRALIISDRAGRKTTLIESPTEKERFIPFNKLEAELLQPEPAKK